MAQSAIIAGVGMTDFGKFPERGHKSLVGEAIVAGACGRGFAARRHTHLAVAENGGGFIGADAAATVVTALEATRPAI
jgi:hypothetical protein